jgi:predicted DNA-binding WGR domain protein
MLDTCGISLTNEELPDLPQLKWKWHNQSNNRHYQVELFFDLLGDWILIRRWKGIARRGNEKMAVVTSYQDGLNQVSRIDRLRTRRGYRRIA